MKDRKRNVGLIRHTLESMRADLRASRPSSVASQRPRRRTPEKAALAVSLHYLDRLSDD